MEAAVTHIEVVHSDFGSFLKNAKKSAFVFDLSHASARAVVSAYVAHKKKVSPNFDKAYSSAILSLERIEEEYGIEIMPDMMTDSFWTYYLDFMQSHGISQSSIATIVSQLRTAIKWGCLYGAKTHPSFDDVKVKKPKSDKIALSPDDVSHIYHFDCKLFYESLGRRSDFIETMERVRDMFVLSCNLFQRYSDMIRIEPSSFDGDMFKTMQQKTGNTASVNLRDYCLDYKVTKAILEKYKYYAPYNGDINNYNKYLHTLLKDMGFTELIQVSHKSNGKVITENIPRWKLISSHTARRTAITNAVLRGTNIHKVKVCSGHASLDMVDRYVKD